MKSVENRVVGYKILGKFYNWNNSTTERDGQNLFHSEASAHSFDINIPFCEKLPKSIKIPLLQTWHTFAFSQNVIFATCLIKNKAILAYISRLTILSSTNNFVIAFMVGFEILLHS